MDQLAFHKKVDELLSEKNTKALFVKDSVPGKMHFQALYDQHRSELAYYPEAVYQIYLPFDMSDKLITINHENVHTEKPIVMEITELLSQTFNKHVFVERSRVDEERNLLDTFQNPEVSQILKLNSFDLWQGVMFYFFV